MDHSEILYKVQTATQDEIYFHLNRCNNNFIPPLEERVNIREYSQKIFENAVTFEAWKNKVLVGLLAAYFNDETKLTGYITNVSILMEFTGIGISSKLMMSAIDYAKQQHFKEIKLEVQIKNFAAIRLYEKFGFTEIKGNNGLILMSINLISDKE